MFCGNFISFAPRFTIFDPIELKGGESTVYGRVFVVMGRHSSTVKGLLSSAIRPSLESRFLLDEVQVRTLSSVVKRCKSLMSDGLHQEPQQISQLPNAHFEKQSELHPYHLLCNINIGFVLAEVAHDIACPCCQL
ncbi:hypothetical protein DY000_02029626 [Brassica cretica]|uniref:Uncharacterized protein n=2 Tax=Brassica cretica TaxID=69181 RepID=A0ABQ7DP04_BRACR|nr:hypothetical protein DY000_02029626 [Brassica cretica]